MTFKGCLSRLVLVAVSSLLTLVVCEVLLGFVWPGSGALDLTAVTVRDDELGHRLVPGSSTTITGVLSDFRTDIDINSHGFRFPEYAPEASDGTFRIALMGDSEVFGVGVDEEDMLNARMEAFLNAGSATRYEVLNFAVPGTGTMVQEKMFAEAAADWDLDAVVFIVTIANDLSDNVVFSRRPKDGVAPPFDTQDADGSPAKPRISLIQRVKGLNLFRLYRFKVMPYLPGFLTPSAKRFGAVPHSVATWYANDGLENDFALMTDAFEHARALCEQRGIEMYITTAPSRSQMVPSIIRMLHNTLDPGLMELIESDPDRPQRMLRSFAEANDIVFVDVLDEFRALAGDGVRLRHPNDGHLNAEGTNEMARILAESVRGD